MYGDEIWDGVVGCNCTQFPITEGILNLGGSGRAHLREAVRLLLAGKAKSARLVQMEIETFEVIRHHLPLSLFKKLNNIDIPWITRLLSTYRRIRCKSVLQSSTFQIAIRTLATSEFSIYLENRFTHPSLLASLPVIMLFPFLRIKHILDLGCGAGHHAFLFTWLLPEANLTCVDRYYINLYLTRKFMAPKARLICLNLDFSLPFVDPFDVVFSSDVFHYLRNKEHAASECLRILNPMGFLVLCHLHNALAFNVVPGQPLTPSEWKRLFARIPHYLYPEDGLLSDFMVRKQIDLGKLLTDRALQASNALSLVGSFERNIPRLSLGDTSSIMLEKKANWVLNPIYKRSLKKNGTEEYKLFWFSEKFRTECHKLEEFLPSTIELQAGVWNNKKIEASRSELIELAKRFIILNYPQNYI